MPELFLASGSLSEKPNQDTQEQAEQDHRSDREIDLKNWSVDDDITGESANRQLEQPGPEQPYQQNGQANID